MCLILFDEMVNEIVSLISFSDSSLLVYRNVTVVCIFIFHPVTFLNTLMSSNSFLVVSLGFFLCIVSYNLQAVTVLLLPFQFGFLLFLFIV